MLNSKLQTNTLQETRANQSALVVGNGLTASIVTAAVKSLGIDVTRSKFGLDSALLFHSGGRGPFEAFVRFLNEGAFRCETTASSTPVEIIPVEKGFVVTFDDGSRSEFGCVFFATEGNLKPIPNDLPDGVNIVTPGILKVPSSQSACFVLDYEEITDPSIGMNAMRMALDNQLSGGNSFVLLRHAPVQGMLGETLYETARLAGVRFLRFGNIAPRIERLQTSNDLSIKFQISIQDIIERGEDILIECDRVFVTVNPLPADIPIAFKHLLSKETDPLGFLIQDSVHCLTGKSFRRGLYCVGPSTGCMDLLETVFSASAAAADARSWLGLLEQAPSSSKMSVSEQCIRCLTCLRLCPHAAISLKSQPSKSSVNITGARCLECGICVAECPRNALDLKGFPEEDFVTLIERLRAQNAHDSTVVFGCHRSAGRALSEIELPEKVIFFPVSCAGRLSESILSATLLAGIKGILVLGCHHGNCRSKNGTDWARARLDTMTTRLNTMFKDIGSFSYKTMAANESPRMLKLINEFLDSVDRIPD